MTTYRNAVSHIYSLGYTFETATDICQMELDGGDDARIAHLKFIMQCDAEDIVDWIGIEPNWVGSGR